MIEKIIARDDEWIEKAERGVKAMGGLVGSTLGPSGRNVIIYRKYKAPMITNDGVTVARETYLEDEVEDLAAQVLVEISMKTNEQAGDGTTGSVVQATALALSCYDKIKKAGFGGGNDAMSLFRQIMAERPKVVEALKEMAQKVGPEELRNIITTSLENREFAEKIAEMIEAVGENGYVSVEDNWDTQYGIETETTLGMKFLGTYSSAYMVNAPRKEAIWKDSAVLLTNENIESMGALEKSFVTSFIKTGKRSLILIASKFETPAIKAFAQAIQQARQGEDFVKVLAIKAPSLTTEEFQDIAAFTGAVFYDSKLGGSVKDAKLEGLGYVEKAVVNEDDVVLTGGKGDITSRLETLQGQVESEKDTMFKNKMKKRIASLSSGVGIIRVGAQTEQERTYMKHKIEDAVHAARAALKEGYVPGAGKALASIADKLGPDSVLYAMLKAPSTKIEENAGGTLEVPDWVIDPVKVIRLSFENACSAAGALISSGSGVTEKRKNLLDLLSKQILEEEEDFRERATRVADL
jgi:chaperonin GroEL